MKSEFENHRLRSMLWIIRELEKRPMSLSELNRRWVMDEGLSGGEEIERRTFCNYIHGIADLWGMDIECDRKNKYRYKIVNRKDTSLSDWMMANFEQQLALERGFNLHNRILVEEAPRGQKNLRILIDAMKTNCMVRFSFKDFNVDEPFEVVGAPYALKMYQQRWYVVIKDEYGLTPFSLDRIHELELTDESFEMDPEFDAKDYFKYSFGVRTIEGEQPSRVLLKVNRAQCDYMRYLPLHHSQKELERHQDFSIFELTVVPTIELTMKLMSMGELVEVLEPADLRETMIEESEYLFQVYH